MTSSSIPTVTLNDDNTMPVLGIGVGELSEDEAERARLKALVGELALAGGHGYIVRTNAEGQSAEALAEDVALLKRLLEA